MESSLQLPAQTQRVGIIFLVKGLVCLLNDALDIRIENTVTATRQKHLNLSAGEIPEDLIPDEILVLAKVSTVMQNLYRRLCVSS